MQIADYMIGELDRVSRNLTRSMKDLTPAELSWRPGSECNSIGLILFHSIRSEDMFVQSKILAKTQLFESGKWSQKMNVPANVTGNGLTQEQVCAFVIPTLADLTAYSESVRKQTVDVVKNGNQDRFDRVIAMGPPFGEMTVGNILGLDIMHWAQHVGEIGYLRGEQKGMNK